MNKLQENTQVGALYKEYQLDTNLPEKSSKTDPFIMEYIYYILHITVFWN